MKQPSDFLKDTTMSVTVCDKTGIVVYQNETAKKNDGNAVGINMLDCHSIKTKEKILRMLSTGQGDTYAIIKNGKREIVHHMPWFSEACGEVAGLIELTIPVPDNYPTFNRDKKNGQTAI